MWHSGPPVSLSAGPGRLVYNGLSRGRLSHIVDTWRSLVHGVVAVEGFFLIVQAELLEPVLGLFR